MSILYLSSVGFSTEFGNSNFNSSYNDNYDKISQEEYFALKYKLNDYVQNLDLDGAFNNLAINFINNHYIENMTNGQEVNASFKYHLVHDEKVNVNAGHNWYYSMYLGILHDDNKKVLSIILDNNTNKDLLQVKLHNLDLNKDLNIEIDDVENYYELFTTQGQHYSLIISYIQPGNYSIFLPDLVDVQFSSINNGDKNTIAKGLFITISEMLTEIFMFIKTMLEIIMYIIVIAFVIYFVGLLIWFALKINEMSETVKNKKKNFFNKVGDK